MSKVMLPVAQMHGCPWNVLDATGSRIALCGGDSNKDWETFGPAIAAEIVAALNADPSAEIDRLRADVERKDDALRKIANASGHFDCDCDVCQVCRIAKAFCLGDVTTKPNS